MQYYPLIISPTSIDVSISNFNTFNTFNNFGIANHSSSDSSPGLVALCHLVPWYMPNNFNKLAWPRATGRQWYRDVVVPFTPVTTTLYVSTHVPYLRILSTSQRLNVSLSTSPPPYLPTHVFPSSILCSLRLTRSTRPEASYPTLFTSFYLILLLYYDHGV